MTDQTPDAATDLRPNGEARPDQAVGPTDSDGNTTDRPAEVEGGQPPVGDDRPRNTEF